MTVNMYKVLQEAVVEKDVENAYKDGLRNILGHISTTIPSPHGTDGVVHASKYKNEDIDLIMLLECKYDVNLKDQLNVVKVLIQALYYLNRFEYYGDDMPKVIMVGDKNECFCLHSNALKDYLDFEGVDWSVAPSSAAAKNPKLIKAMMQDEKTVPYVFNVNKDFQFEKLIEKAIALSKDQVNFIRITEKNIDRVFNRFITDVLYYKNITKAEANKLVNVFLSILINPDENYLHPENKQTLVTKNFGNVRVDRMKFKTFFRHFEKKYTPKEKDHLTAICDRLIEDTTRRFQGEFFTPTPWVEEAHRMIEKEFGDDWKEEYVVWDPAWGTGNLTRDYKFKELYVSTLNASDIGLAEQRGYNPEAVKFQYDFLNDPYDKLPEGLRNAIEGGKKIVVLMNPPYSAAGIMKKINDIGKKTGVSSTSIGNELRKLKLGHAGQQLYTQFLYRCYKLVEEKEADLSIGVYSPAIFLSGPGFKKFRNLYLDKYKYISGMFFNASHFADVSKEWGILFSLWKSGKESCVNQFQVIVKDMSEDGVADIDNKCIYNLDSTKNTSTWVREFGEKAPLVECVQLKNALSIATGKTQSGSQCENSIGYFHNDSASVKQNGQFVGLYSTAFSLGHGLPVGPDNIKQVTALFTARKIIKANWFNNLDEYMAPNTGHPDYGQWNDDCFVYSLFNNHSNQSSLRNIEYKGKTWDIKNQWFWMSRKQMLELANTHGFDALYQDARVGDEERFVFNKLKGLELSIDALGVLLHAKELVETSFEFRETLHQAHPEYHLNTWDAGWYQIKLILKEFMPDKLKEFREAYRAFEERMEKGVYEFGFLKQ